MQRLKRSNQVNRATKRILKRQPKARDIHKGRTWGHINQQVNIAVYPLFATNDRPKEARVPNTVLAQDGYNERPVDRFPVVQRDRLR